MNDGQTAGGLFACHRGAPYRARRLLPLAALVLLAALLARRANAAPPTLKASGTARRFEVKVAGGEASFHFTVVAGCRYRLTAVPGSLERPILEVGRVDEDPIVRVDSGASGKSAVHTWDAERDARMQARVRGFSAQVGGGRIRLETLGHDDEPVRAHRRFLWPGQERARVGELLLGEVNRWELVVTVGKSYEITPTRGSAGLVRLQVLRWDGKVIADSTKTGVAWLARPPVRFRAPPRKAPGDESVPKGKRPKKKRRKPKLPPAIRLVVRGIFDGGGTYGVRMRELDPDEYTEPPEISAPDPVERGPVEGESNTFRAGPGDVSVLYVPRSPNLSQRVELLRGERWVYLEDAGMGGSARSQENALVVWFQPYYPGTYRFRGIPADPPSTPRLLLHDRSKLGSAPIHMGTGADPTVRVRLGSKWKLVGLGVCMPGWDYLFVCVHGPDQGIAMRVRYAAGKTLRMRGASERTISPGLGPSLRFRAPKAGVYRLEARNARKRVVRPLLRRASN